MKDATQFRQIPFPTDHTAAMAVYTGPESGGDCGQSNSERMIIELHDRIIALEANHDAMLQGLADNGCEVTHATDETGPWVLNVRADNMARQRDALAAEVERLQAIVGKLLDKWDRSCGEVEAVFVTAAMHGHKYTGESIKPELDDLRAAITREAAEAARGAEH